MPELTLEIGREPRHFICDHCGGAGHTTHGFVYRDGDAYAIYFGTVHTCQSRRNTALDSALTNQSGTVQMNDRITRASMAIAIGDDWNDEDDSSVFSAFLRVDLTEDEYQFSFIEPEISGWSHSKILVNQLEPLEARKHPRRNEFFEICDIVIARDLLFSKDPS